MKHKIVGSIALCVFFGVLLAGTVYGVRHAHDVVPVVVSVDPDRQELVSIDQTPSTNFSGINLTIYTDGSESVEYPTESVTFNPVSSATQYLAGTIDTTELQASLYGVGDVSRLTRGICGKSASFGTETYVTYQGKTSPDIQCLSDISQQKYPFFVGDINEALQPYEDQLPHKVL